MSDPTNAEIRDAVQEAAGRVPVLIIMVAGSVLSWFIEPTFALASGAAFLVSELDVPHVRPRRETAPATRVARCRRQSTATVGGGAG